MEKRFYDVISVETGTILQGMVEVQFENPVQDFKRFKASLEEQYITEVDVCRRHPDPINLENEPCGFCDDGEPLSMGYGMGVSDDPEKNYFHADDVGHTYCRKRLKLKPAGRFLGHETFDTQFRDHQVLQCPVCGLLVRTKSSYIDTEDGSQRHYDCLSDHRKEQIRITNMQHKKPLFNHDCDKCTFLGSFEGADLYYCKEGNMSIDTVIARLSDEPADYQSGLGFTMPLLAEAERRARKMGYYTGEEA